MATSLFEKLNLQLHHVRFSCAFAWGLFLLALLAAPAHNLQQIVTYRPVDANETDGGKFIITSGAEAELMIFGTDLINNTEVFFSSSNESCCHLCLKRGGNIEIVDDENEIQRASLMVQLSLETPETPETLYFCLSEEDDLVHQGSEPWLTIVVKPPETSPSPLLPLSVEIIFIIFLMLLSGLFSGLNLGLMSLDPTTLKIITDSGTKFQRIYAKLIYRVRKHGNYLLCTLLLGNVLVNSTLTILLDEVLPSGIYAVVASTLAIVIFGEIIPQAICSRHGLVVGGWTIPLTIFFMILTFPLSLPLSLILNAVLGKEIGSVYNRDQLLKLLHVTKEHHDMENDEVDVIAGALGYKKKQAKDVMTNLEDVFCIGIDSVLDFEMMKEIYNSGFSRIPVYEDSKENVVNLLYVRDLAFVDSDDKTTVASHVQFYQHDLLFFFEDTPLGEILKDFLEGKCHLGVIQTILEVPDKDPVYAAIGVVTLEDIVEEILQREIVDETDRFVDNRSFKPRVIPKKIDVGEFVSGSTNSLTSQQRLAVYQFLSTEVEPFTSKFMISSVLKRLLTQKNVAQKISCEEYIRRNSTLYSYGCPADFFCFVLEGCIEVEIGKDGLKFESRSFSYFGAQALLLDKDKPDRGLYKPDFTARPLTDCLVLIITQDQYLAARKASQFDGGRSSTADGGGIVDSSNMSGTIGRSEVFNREWAKAGMLDLNKPQKKSSSIFQLLSRHSESATGRGSPDQVRLLPLNGEGDSSNSSEAGTPVAIKMDFEDREEHSEPNDTSSC